MAQRKPDERPRPVLDQREVVLAAFIDEDGEEIIRYFASEDEADAAIPSSATQASLDAMGAWADLNWEEVERELERIRRSGKQSAPLNP